MGYSVEGLPIVEVEGLPSLKWRGRRGWGGRKARVHRFLSFLLKSTCRHPGVPLQPGLTGRQVWPADQTWACELHSWGVAGGGLRTWAAGGEGGGGGGCSGVRRRDGAETGLPTGLFSL